jgi:putative GTP pyrophosphokinase
MAATSDNTAASAGLAQADLDPTQIDHIRRAHRNALSRNKSLLEEVIYILSNRLQEKNIKIHAIEHRVKDVESLIDKCKRARTADLDLIRDIVGARVICLFRSDMEMIGKIISSNFEIVEVDDKLADSNNPLGYMSVHYICKMPNYSGPRYENTANIPFEIQVRTLCMHCWAAVSHHLDYKGEWDVPAGLKRALSALGGLFYVADDEFEHFNAARLASKKSTEIDGGSLQQDINLDTVSAYLRRTFPDRRGSDPTNISELVREIRGGGISIPGPDRR